MISKNDPDPTIIQSTVFITMIQYKNSKEKTLEFQDNCSTTTLYWHKHYGSKATNWKKQLKLKNKKARNANKV